VSALAADREAEDERIQALADASLRAGGAEAYEIITEAIAEDLSPVSLSDIGISWIDQKNAIRRARASRELTALCLALADGDEATVGRIVTDIVMPHALHIASQRHNGDR